MRLPLSSHLSHIQQVDLQEKAQSTSSYLIWRSSNGITQLTPDRQTPFLLLLPLLKEKEREEM